METRERAGPHPCREREGKITQFFNEDRISPAQQIGIFFLDLTQNAHAQAGAGEGVAVNHFGGEAQGHTEFADFVFKQVAQGFQELQAQLLWQSTHVVVAFDDHGFFAFGTTRLDDVGVNGALGQEGGTFCSDRCS